MDNLTAQLLAIGHGFDWRAWPPEDRSAAAVRHIERVIEKAAISKRSLELLKAAISADGDEE